MLFYNASPTGSQWIIMNQEATPRGEGLLPYMLYSGMCHCEGYGFLAP